MSKFDVENGCRKPMSCFLDVENSRRKQREKRGNKRGKTPARKRKSRRKNLRNPEKLVFATPTKSKARENIDGPR